MVEYRVRPGGWPSSGVSNWSTVCDFQQPKDGILCRHMVVVAMSSKIDGLTRIHIMPYWWTTAHWRDQCPMDVNCPTDISLNTEKTSAQANDKLRYCPAWLAARKKGWPKMDVNEKSVTDLIEESAKKKKRARRIRLFCNICFKHKITETDLSKI